MWRSHGCNNYIGCWARGTSVAQVIQERHRRSCCGVRVSSADTHKSAPLQSAGGFISVGDWTCTETSLFYSLFIEVGVFSAEIINKMRRGNIKIQSQEAVPLYSIFMPRVLTEKCMILRYKMRMLGQMFTEPGFTAVC